MVFRWIVHHFQIRKNEKSGFFYRDTFREQCWYIILKLQYPENLINSTITRFIESRTQQQVRDVQANAPVRVILLFKDQRSADVVRRQLSDLGKKINSDLRPVFTSKKIADDIKVAEAKPPLINQQRVVYKFKCDLYHADYVGYTRRHLFNALRNTNTLLLENTCVTRTIRETTERSSRTIHHS